MSDFSVMFPGMRKPISVPEPTLFGDALIRRGAVSTFVGNFFETLVSDLLLGEVIKTDSHYLFCPDVILGRKGVAIEIKSARRGGEFFVSDKQLVKYQELACKGYTSWYAFCSYTPKMVKQSDYRTRVSLAKTLRGKTYEESLELISDNIDYIIVVDIQVLECILKTYATRRSCDAWVRNGRSDRFTYLRSSSLYPARSNIIQFLKDADVNREDFIINMSVIKNASILGKTIKPFDFIVVSKSENKVVEITTQSVIGIEEMTTDIPEEEVPF